MQIRFCRDGILRRYESAYDHKTEVHHGLWLPVRAFEDIEQQPFLKCLAAAVEFEDGLTVAEFFQNLKPWQDIMTGIAHMDFPAFVAESEKPRYVDPDRYGELSHIVIEYYATIEGVPRFERDWFDDEDDGADLEEEQSGTTEPLKKAGYISWKAPKSIPTDLLQLDYQWGYSAYYKEPVVDEHAGAIESCSVDYSPLDTWSHLPMKLASKSVLRDRTAWVSHNFLTSDLAITNGAHPLATVLRSSDGETIMSHEFPLDVPTPTFFEAIVRGFLWNIGFHYSPAMRDLTSDEIMHRAEEVNRALEGADPIPFDEDEYDREKAEQFRREMAHIAKIREAARHLGLPVVEDTPD